MENKILALREKYNLTRADIEKKYAIPQKTLYNWETGIRKCPDYVITLLEKSIISDNDESKKQIEIFFESRENPERDMETAIRAMRYMEMLAENKG